MTNVLLKDFKKALHHHLLPENNGKNIRIREIEKKSKIKSIDFCFQNQDDVLIIRQDPKKCEAIKNLFHEKDLLESCDFIVLICRKSKLNIFFCEIKSSLSNAAQEKAINQIESSKIFFKYLCENYKKCFQKDIEFDIGIAKNIMIYPAPISKKKGITPRYNRNMKLVPIKYDDKGRSHIDDGYGFFKS